MDNSSPSLLSWAEERLATTSSTPRLDAELLLAHQLGLSRTSLLTTSERLRQPVLGRFERAVVQRSRGEPVAYLLREKEFYGRTFFVDERVLVPRPETELLVELPLKEVTSHQPRATSLTILDIGTGSGNIIVTLAAELKERPNLRFIATDISQDALEVAKRNAERHGVLERITFLHGSLLDPLRQLSTVNGQLLFVANLPYVADHWVKDLASDIKYFEPKLALAGGPTGLELYGQLFAQLRQLIVNGQLLPVRLYVEHDPRQLEALQGLVRVQFGRQAVSHPDLAQLPRVLEITPA